MAENNEIDISLLLDEDNLENAELLQFYHEVLTRLDEYIITDLGVITLREMTDMIESTLLDQKNGWKEYAYRLGIEDSHILNRIQLASYRRDTSGLYLAISTIAAEKRLSIGKLVEVLMGIPRLDVLDFLKPSIRKILMKKSSEVKDCYQSAEASQCSKVTDCKDFAGLESCSTEGTSSANDNKCDELLLNGLCPMDSFTVKLSSSKNELISNTIPSAPADENRIKVFIMNTENETSEAEKLSLMLREEGVLARTWHNMDVLLRVNMDDALRFLVNEVDFFIPIVSTRFLQQVHAPPNSSYFEFQDTWYNRNLYQLLSNEYSFGGCLNFRVRAVLLPDFDKRLLVHEKLFSPALKLWEEVPKLITVLQKILLLRRSYN